MMDKPLPSNIVLQRTTGKVTSQITIATFDEANAELAKLAETVPKKGDSDRVNYQITWPNGYFYRGSLVLAHISKGKPDLQAHVASYLLYMAGRENVPWLSREEYKKRLEEYGAELKAYVEAILSRCGLGISQMPPETVQIRPQPAKSAADSFLF